MASIKTIALLLLLGALGTGGLAFVTSRQKPDLLAKRITQKMSKRLQLSQVQEDVVYQINLKRVVGQNAKHSAISRRTAIREVVHVWSTELKSVLSSEQRTKLFGQS